MYEISFYDKDKLVVKNGAIIWRSLSSEASAALTTIVNNSYLKRNHPQLRNLDYITSIECKVKYHSEKDLIVNGHCYWFNNYFTSRNKKLIAREIHENLTVVPEIYVPNILFNGKGIWVISNGSCLKEYHNGIRLFSRNKNVKFKTREFSKAGLLI